MSRLGETKLTSAPCANASGVGSPMEPNAMTPKPQAAISIPTPILRGAEGSFPFLAKKPNIANETGVKAITVAKDGIAIIVNPNNPVADLSVEQIAQLATGEITNWADVGGTDGQVVFMGREAGSGTRDGFESITGTKDACKYQNELTSTGEVIAAVASNPNAIGYASLSAVDETVKAITVGGVEPTEETVLDGSYAIQRNFNFIVSDSTPLSEAAQAFVDFATSADASDLIAGAGAVPVAE